MTSRRDESPTRPFGASAEGSSDEDIEGDITALTMKPRAHPGAQRGASGVHAADFFELTDPTAHRFEPPPVVARDDDAHSLDARIKQLHASMPGETLDDSEDGDNDGGVIPIAPDGGENTDSYRIEDLHDDLPSAHVSELGSFADFEHFDDPDHTPAPGHADAQTGDVIRAARDELPTLSHPHDHAPASPVLQTSASSTGAPPAAAASGSGVSQPAAALLGDDDNRAAPAGLDARSDRSSTAIIAIDPGTDSAPPAGSTGVMPVLMKWSAGPVTTTPPQGPDLAALSVTTPADDSMATLPALSLELVRRAQAAVEGPPPLPPGAPAGHVTTPAPSSPPPPVFTAPSPPPSASSPPPPLAGAFAARTATPMISAALLQSAASVTAGATSDTRVLPPDVELWREELDAALQAVSSAQMQAMLLGPDASALSTHLGRAAQRLGELRKRLDR